MIPYFGYDHEARLRSVFGPLQDLPDNVGCHVVSFEDAGADFALCDDNQGRGWGGYTSPVLDLHLEEVLRAANRWTGGRSFATIIWADKFKTPDETFAAVCHEYGHWLTSDDLSRDAPRELLPDRTIGTMTQSERHKQDILIAEHFAKQPAATVPLPWVFHELDFLRASIHVFFRVNRGASSITFPIGIGGHAYGMSDWSAFSSAMRAEIHDRSSEPIRKILTTEAPAELRAVYQSDLNQYARFKEWQRSGPWAEQAAHYEAWKTWQHDAAV